MSEQIDIFDLEAARREREEGIRKAEVGNQEFLNAARALAIHICRQRGTVTMDDIRRELRVAPRHPNAYGSVFKNARFKFTGEYRQSELKSRHGSMQRVWRLA